MILRREEISEMNVANEKKGENLARMKGRVNDVAK